MKSLTQTRKPYFENYATDIHVPHEAETPLTSFITYTCYLPFSILYINILDFVTCFIENSHQIYVDYDSLNLLKMCYIVTRTYAFLYI